VVLLLNRKKIKEERAEILIFSIVLAVAGGLIQIISVDILTIYPAITYSLIFVFILFEALGDIRDTLTNTYTRKKILEIIENSIMTNNEFILVLFDLDNLKQINDEIGHVAGDKAIKQFTQDLKAIFGSNVQLGRIGGDEFLMMARDFSTSYLSSKLEKVSGYYTFNNHKYEYSYSYGVVHRKEDDNRDLDQLINYVDGEMYTMKAEHKNYKRRSTDESKLK